MRCARGLRSSGCSRMDNRTRRKSPEPGPDTIHAPDHAVHQVRRHLESPAGDQAGQTFEMPAVRHRFTISESDASSASTVPGIADATAASAFDMQKRSNPPDDLPPSLGSGDLREAFDLPLVSGVPETRSAMPAVLARRSRRRRRRSSTSDRPGENQRRPKPAARGGGALPAAPACRGDVDLHGVRDRPGHRFARRSRR